MKRFVRLLYNVAARVRVVYWFLFRPQTKGVKCVIENNGEWLMIRNSYAGGRWTFPGGAIDRGETPDHAAIREVREEVGISLPSVRSIGYYQSNRQYKHDTVHCFLAGVPTRDHRIDDIEVIDSAWFAPGEIPAFRGKAVDQVLELIAQPRRSEAEGR